MTIEVRMTGWLVFGHPFIISLRRLLRWRFHLVEQLGDDVVHFDLPGLAFKVQDDAVTE
jgi:hypothetical protein